jgi:glycosyltransferase involved in cell wall biosynthesis
VSIEVKIKDDLDNVTVVIPTANRGELLNRSVNSVLEQSFKPFEIIIVDNGNQRCYRNQSAPKSVTIIKTPPNIGASKARNKGLSKVKTKYVAFLDDDDTWDKDYLYNLMNVICSNRCDVVVGSLHRKRSSDNHSIFYKEFPSNLCDQRKVYYSNPGFGGQNFLINSNFLLKIGGFDETLIGSEDRDLAARIIENNGLIIPVPNAVAILYDHGGPRNRLEKRIKGLMQFLSKHKKYMTKKEIVFAYIKLLDHLQKITRRKFAYYRLSIHRKLAKND